MGRDRVSNACLGCEERKIGCHSNCPRYAVFREHTEAISAAKKRSLDEESYFAVKAAKLHEAANDYKKRMERR